MDRRNFLTYLGSSTAALAMASSGVSTVHAELEQKWNKGNQGKKGYGKPLTAPFRPIERTWENDLVLPKGYHYNIIASYNDVINSKGEKFGDSADLTVYFPIDSLEGGSSSEEGLIWVNHEFPEPQNYIKMLGINSNQYEKSKLENYPKLLKMEKESVGGSVIHIRKEDGQWKLIKDDNYNRRVTAETPIKFTGPAKGSQAVKGATKVEGTLGNCSGGRTLWNTVLSCEENTFYGEEYGWPNFTDEHYGWVVEVDPFNPDSEIRKHTALGRFAHENAAMTLTKNNKVAVYMGDDTKDEFFFKFISEKTYNKNSREANFDILEKGTLYVADLENQRWIALDYETNEKLQNHEKDGEKFFSNQADVLTYAREAARAVYATPLDRPEDVEINPEDGSVFLCLTNNSNHGNFYGQIVRFEPEGNDHGSDKFTFQVFVAGGRESGITCPDNLHFDSKANLWVMEDFGATEDNIYAEYKNCGAFLIPTDGRNYGEPFQFASGPLGSEVTGPWLTPDERTLFLDVQHPESWNKYPGYEFGRSCLVAVEGGRFNK